MSSWSCPSCRKVGIGRSPTWRQPRRCGRCEVLVWPDGLYSYDRDTPLRVDIDSRSYTRAVSHLSAYIGRDGALVLEWQDLGPAVSSMWGDSDYEYWVTVPASRLNYLVRSLHKELKARSILVSGVEDAVIQSELSKRDVDYLALILVRAAFANDIFTTDSEFRDWLKRKRIRSSFFSY